MGNFADIKHAHRFSLEGEELEHVFLEKDLRVLIDSNLTFEDHIAEKVKKANSMLGWIKRSFNFLTPAGFVLLYTSFVRPHLEYAQSIWSPKLRKHINLIESVQRRATKLLSCCKNLLYSERLKMLGLPSLEFRRHFGDMVQIYKHLHVYDQSTLPNKLVRRTRPCRRHNFELQPLFANDGFRGAQNKSFYYRCISTWNKLPRNAVGAPNIKTFKERLNAALNDYPQRYNQG